MNMPKSRDIQAKIPLPQAIWNEFWLRYCERSEQEHIIPITFIFSVLSFWQIWKMYAKIEIANLYIK